MAGAVSVYSGYSGLRPHMPLLQSWCRGLEVRLLCESRCSVLGRFSSIWLRWHEMM
jgi:hypothetical protein